MAAPLRDVVPSPVAHVRDHRIASGLDADLVGGGDNGAVGVGICRWDRAALGLEPLEADRGGRGPHNQPGLERLGGRGEAMGSVLLHSCDLGLTLALHHPGQPGGTA